MNDQKRYHRDLLLTVLSEREWLAVLKYFIENKTQTEIAEEFGVTRSRVFQIIWKAIRKLRHPLRLGRYLLEG